ERDPLGAHRLRACGARAAVRRHLEEGTRHMSSFRSPGKSSSQAAPSAVATRSHALFDRRTVIRFIGESLRLAWQFFIICAAGTAGVIVGSGLLIAVMI